MANRKVVGKQLITELYGKLTYPSDGKLRNRNPFQAKARPHIPYPEGVCSKRCADAARLESRVPPLASPHLRALACNRAAHTTRTHGGEFRTRGQARVWFC